MCCLPVSSRVAIVESGIGELLSIAPSGLDACACIGVWTGSRIGRLVGLAADRDVLTLGMGSNYCLNAQPSFAPCATSVAIRSAIRPSG